ncbi:MAG: aspartyl/asparaginyl beta-hydroxylase domain-containing protein [Ferruginibacter sp.]
MQIIKYLQLPFYFDVSRLQQEVNLLMDAHWQMHYQTLQYEGSWAAIPLRSIDGKSDHIIVAPIPGAEYKDTEFLISSPYLQEILSTFKCPLMAVRLLKLDAGAIIKEHKDAELCFEKGEIRIHIPVITNEQVEFYLDKERLFLKEGESWYMNFNLPHNINNYSDQNRIHLVIDAVVNDWVKELFNRNDLPVKKEIQEQQPQYDEATKKFMIARFREMNTPVAHELADKLEREMF